MLSASYITISSFGTCDFITISNCICRKKNT